VRYLHPGSEGHVEPTHGRSRHCRRDSLVLHAAPTGTCSAQTFATLQENPSAHGTAPSHAAPAPTATVNYLHTCGAGQTEPTHGKT
jgi:hypothetical protein